ncbi:MAG: carboxypeptidase-like regulatory domain-containing protein [Thermoflexales bacterium]|nr:carboxypeptidase-like regulatory domain-containing protein [Thermoflexales bacterium]
MTMAALDQAGLYRPGDPNAPGLAENVRRQIRRNTFSPSALEQLKTESPDIYSSLNDDTAIDATLSPRAMPAPLVSFLGETTADQTTVGEPMYIPPDSNGDVGPNHYVQTVNTTWGVFNKTTGTRILGPLKVNSLFSGFGGPCETTNHGSPIVLYDQLADRWMISQVALPNIGTYAGPFYQCIAVSTSPNPTGSYYRYEFLFSNTDLNDYPHFGMWPDGYYATVNAYTAPDFTPSGMAAIAYERDKMLLGQPAKQVIFKLSASGSPINTIAGGLPADLDGLALPPAGSPQIIAAPEAAEWTSYPSDRVHFFKFHVDWATPANSTFTGPTDVDVAAFTPLCDTTRACVPQSGTTAKLDAIGDRFMWRLAYRNFGSYQNLVVNQTVDAGSGVAGVRWYEFRSPHATTPTIYQQSTYAPADGISRWMGSAAQDKLGNLAIGFSASNAAMFPAIRYAGRLASDPLNVLSQGETVLIAGGGSQTHTANRWGDYSNLTLDPTDDCTFWYTNEYYAATSWSDWSTRIGSFRFPGCVLAQTSAVSGTVTDLVTGLPISGAVVVASNGYGLSTSAVGGAAGGYIIGVVSGTYTVTASAYGYLPSTITGIIIPPGVTVTVPLTLTPAPRYIVSGTVTEQGSGLPLSGTVSAAGSPFTSGLTVNTNPATGFYSMTLVAGGQSYALTAGAVSHLAAVSNTGVLTRNQTINFQLVPTTTKECYGRLFGDDGNFHRPLTGNPPTALSGFGTDFYYDALPFKVGNSGIFTMTMYTAGNDGFYVLYQTAFDPSSPLTNALQSVDDTIGFDPRISRALTAGTQYILVSTAYFTSSVARGSFYYTNTLTGPGTISAVCPAAPELIVRRWLPIIVR